MAENFSTGINPEIINISRTLSRAPVPVVVTVYHREQQTKEMLEQLARVTDLYSLVVVSNGFDDPDYLRGVNPSSLIENAENNGAIKSVNQGLDLADGEFVVVLHSDVLIFDEGWLDHILAFMERRVDVGLVGLAGRHGIDGEGRPINESTVLNQDGHPECYRPTWRFTEVAAVDGLGWVMRNDGRRLDETLGMMHFYDMDLSLQYIADGLKVYVADIDLEHVALDPEKSCRNDADYREAIGGDDDLYYEEVRERFRGKWAHLLPIWRGGQDEAYLENLLAEHRRLVDGYNELRAELVQTGEYARHVWEDLLAKSAELERAADYARVLEAEIEKLRSTANPPPDSGGARRKPHRRRM
ncbi:MAG: glycosyltransferase [Candidatus Geothermincolia bacterium]